jgi:DNA-binding CsgD family transcriptional regulator
LAGPEKIKFPSDYLKGVLYQTLDRTDTKQYRELYATPAAVEALRSACGEWEELEMPYETARARALVGLAYRALGDEEGADLELDVARRVLRDLGASPDLLRLDALSSKPSRRAAHGLTARELEVLVLVARGRSNKEIAAELVISDRTVARHISNIFTKLGVSTRTAASAFAFEHEFV